MDNINNIENIELELTSLCNAKCKLCFRQSMYFPNCFKTPYIRKIDELISQLSTFSNLKIVQLIGQMSEPLMYPQIVQLLQYLKERKIKVVIYTNGSFDKNVFHSIGKYLNNNDEVYFTICGLTQKQHETYRQNTSLTKILNGNHILKFVYKIHTVMTYIVFEYNKDTIYQPMFKILSKLFSSISIINNNIFKPVEDFNISAITDIYTNKAKRKIIAHINSIANILFEEKNKNNIECMSIQKKHAFIDVFGNIFPCFYFFEMYHNSQNWNFNDILNKKYDCCKYCQSEVKKTYSF